MICFTLKCTEGHRFDSWFQSADAFDKLKAAGHVACAVCGSAQVEKAVMAPRVSTARKKASADATQEAPSPDGGAGPLTGPLTGPLSAPASAAEQALAELKRHVEANSEYVGPEFAREARAMHDGEAPERSIYGEAQPEEAKKLVEDGVKVAPLPFRPGRKSN